MVSQTHTVYDDKENIVGMATFVRKNGMVIFSQSIPTNVGDYSHQIDFKDHAAFDVFKRRQGYFLADELGQLDLFNIKEDNN